MPKGIRSHGHTVGYTASPTFRSWQNMIGRCTQPSNPAYLHYQQRGIAVCKRWLSFDNFLSDMGVRPGGKREYTLERIDNSRGYEPGNCRWATWIEQGNNRVTNVVFEYRGQPYTMAQLARYTGVSKELLRSRLCRSTLPWTVEGAVSSPKVTRTNWGFHC